VTNRPYSRYRADMDVNQSINQSTQAPDGFFTQDCLFPYLPPNECPLDQFPAETPSVCVNQHIVENNILFFAHLLFQVYAYLIGFAYAVVKLVTIIVNTYLKFGLV